MQDFYYRFPSPVPLCRNLAAGSSIPRDRHRIKHGHAPDLGDRGLPHPLRFGIVWVIAYLAFILILEYRLLRGHCVDGYYYGKTCAFGKGRLSALLFRKGDPGKFCRMQITRKDIVPDFLVFFVPVLAGISGLVLAFSWTNLVFIVALLLLGFAGNAFVWGHLACRYCWQREIGCPAEQLFRKPEKL